MALPSLFRFLAAFFGSTFLTCAGGSIADLWSPLEAKFSLPFMMITAYAGAMLGPVISAYMGESPVISWRWVDWTMPIFAVVVMALVLLFQPEAYEPFLLSCGRLRSFANHGRQPIQDRVGSDAKLFSVESSSDQHLSTIPFHIHRTDHHAVYLVFDHHLHNFVNFL